MSLAAQEYDAAPAGRGGLEVKRKPSTKFNLYPSNSPIPTNNLSSRGTHTMRLAPAMNGNGAYGLPVRPKTGNSPHSQRSYRDDTSRPYTPHQYPPHTLRKQPSEGSRLHALNNGYASPVNGRSTPDRGRYTPDTGRRTPDIGRQTPDRPPPVVENFSRPRKSSLVQNNLSPSPLLTAASTFPLSSQNESRINASYSTQATRDRGFSTSSSQSNTIHHPPVQAPPALKSSSSIPDYNSAGQIYSRHRHINNSHYQPDRGPSRLDSNRQDSHNNSASRLERTTEHSSDEEPRTSFRSALTTNSSFVASGTERSSILTKSSSVTSFFPQEDGSYDEEDGMSVDDAIGMYEDGFHDSDPEGHDEESLEDDEDEHVVPSLSAGLPLPQMMGPKSETAESAPVNGELEKRRSKIAEAMNDTLALPRDNNARDTMNFFSGHVSLDHFGHGQHSPRGSSPMRGRSQIPSFDGANDDDDVPREPSITETLAITGKNPNIPPPFGENRDRYGFKKTSVHINLAQYDEWNGPYTEYLIRRRKKWIVLMQESKLMTDKPIRFPPKSAKVKRFVRKGIPPDWRGAAWFYYAGGPAELAKHDGLYKQLLEMRGKGALSENDEELIERDLHRTFPDNLKFKPDSPAPAGNESQSSIPEPETPTLQALRRVLQAFSILNPKIGYCQSLNFLAGLLLLFMDEERAFWMLNIITRHLPGTHEVNLEGANVDLGVLMSSIKEDMPSIWAKINGDLDGQNATKAGTGGGPMRLPPITLCTTAWFMSCFIGTLPIETTLRVWDSFFYEGSKTLFRIALAIFKTGEPEIKAVSDPMEIFQVVQTIPRRLIDANALLEMTFERWNGFRHLSQEEIEKRRKERREGYAEERRVAAGGGEATQRRGMFGRRKKTGLAL